MQGRQNSSYLPYYSSLNLMKIVLLTTQELLSKRNPDKYGLLDLFIILAIKTFITL